MNAHELNRPTGTVADRWPRFLVVVLGLAGLAFAVQFVSGIQAIIAPVFLALNLVIVAYPLQKRLVAVRVPRFVAAMLTVVIVLLVIFGFFAITVWCLAELVLVMPNYTDELTVIWNDLLAWIVSWGISPDYIADQLVNFDFASLTGVATSVLSNASSVLGLITLAAMAVFFIAIDSMSFTRRVALTRVVRPEFSAAMLDFADGVRRYWVVATVFGLIVAALDVLALMIIGVPLLWVWGVLAFLTNYIPNIGFIIGLVPPALIALIDGGWWDAMWVVIAYCVLNFVIQSIIQPKFTGESVGVTPFMSFLSLFFWTWVLGPLGALLALPSTLLVKAFLVDADPRARWVNNLIASDLSTGSWIPVRSSAGIPDELEDTAHPRRSVLDVEEDAAGDGAVEDGAVEDAQAGADAQADVKDGADGTDGAPREREN
ncbi:AI-2E family transporter [Brevibacterium litoralis]|uniref:AI-2E family transporter n=1 Tax=Brevibacterium litoralis TaxID=3138935 RepID=UPI0032EB4692